MSPRTSNRTVVVIALLVLTFVSGISIGIIGDRLISRRQRGVARITTDLNSVLDDLSLTRDQRLKADSILERSAPRTEEAMFEIAGRLRAISDSVDMELRSILTAPQRSKLDSLRRRPIFLLKRPQTNGTTSVDTMFLQKSQR